MNGSSVVGLDQPGQVGLLDRRVDVRVAVVLEDPEVAVEPHVDARGLHHAGVVRLEHDPAGIDLGGDVAVGQEHAGHPTDAARPLELDAES